MRRILCVISCLFSLAGMFGLWKLLSVRNAIDAQNRDGFSVADRLYADCSIWEQNFIIMTAFSGLIGVLMAYIGLTLRGATSKFEMGVTSVLSLAYVLGIILLFLCHFAGAQ